MLRSLFLIAVSIALTHAATAQAPEPKTEKPKVVKVHALMKSGANLQIVQPDIVDRKLCGYVRAADVPPGTAWKKDCVALADIADTRVEGAKYALADSIDGAMCIVLMPLCFAKVSAVQDRIVENAIAKAKAR